MSTAAAVVTRPTRDRGRRLFEPLRIWIFAMSAGYALLVIVGVTTSSIGIPSLVDQPGAPSPGLVAGSPEPIRSGEFLRGTPWVIDTIVSGDGSGDRGIGL